MPRTKKQTGPTPQPPAANRPVTGEVLTLAEAATCLTIAEADVLRLVRELRLPGRQVGAEWRFLAEVVHDWRGRKTVRDVMQSPTW